MKESLEYIEQQELMILKRMKKIEQMRKRKMQNFEKTMLRHLETKYK